MLGSIGIVRIIQLYIIMTVLQMTSHFVSVSIDLSSQLTTKATDAPSFQQQSLTLPSQVILDSGRTPRTRSGLAIMATEGNSAVTKTLEVQPA
jgi:hypothetical protein